MKVFVILLAAGLLTACASAPKPNPWDSITVDQSPATEPLRLPDRCLPVEVTDTAAVFDRQGVLCLDSYYEIAEANTDIAAEQAEQVDDLKQAASDLVEAGQAQRRVADIRQEILEDERKAHFYEKIGLWGLVLLSIGAGGVL